MKSILELVNYTFVRDVTSYGTTGHAATLSNCRNPAIFHEPPPDADIKILCNQFTLFLQLNFFRV